MECRKKMLYCTDVIEVPVGENECLDPLLPPAKSGNVGNKVVDTRHILLGKLQAKVDDVQIAIDIDDEAVPTDFLETAEGIDAKTLSSAECLLLPLRLLLWRPELPLRPLKFLWCRRNGRWSR
jgi:hypothetical protein